MKPLSSETFPLSGNRLIEASAGTGKTYTITNLYLRLLLGRGSPPRQVSEILVLTFTEAATKELRSRIRERIRAAHRALIAGENKDEFLGYLASSSDDLDRDTRLLAAALQLMDEASIFTIHGFCKRVLSDNAFETGTLFNQNLDADRDLLLERATEDCFRSFVLTLPPLARTLALELWKSPADLHKKVSHFLFRHEPILLPPYKDVSVDELANKISEVKRRWLEADFPSVIRDAGVIGSTRNVKQLPAMTDWCRGNELVTDLWELWTTEALSNVRLRKEGHIPSHPLIGDIDEIHAELTQLPFNLWQDVTRIIKDNLSRYKAELGQLTLDDLLVNVHAALGRSTTGEWLASRLAGRWPVAMIDEFQDTDDVQYEIFARIYAGTGHRSLFFIGDPKQAIYQFRGADVFTYINARRAVSADDIFSLSTNWRSTAPLINAVNHLFNHHDIFGNDRDIPFVPVNPSVAAAEHTFIDGGTVPAPITLFQVSGEDLTADTARRLAMGFAAEETSRLLAGAEKGQILIDGKRLEARHIAFLVRTRTHAKVAREALTARGISSVYVTLDSVFDTDTAGDLYTIMEAVLEPANERALRAALAVTLMQSSASEIDRLSSDVAAQQSVLDEFEEYHRLWATLDVATMISTVIGKRRIAQKWLGKPEGERQITNLRHLAELLQHRAAASPGMRRLLKWFARQRHDAQSVTAEERQLRLESDKNLVQIVTMHAAKGLEYEIVMIPEAAFAQPSGSRHPPWLFHEHSDDRFHTCVDFSEADQSQRAALAEQQAEDLRLLYVAITRAKHKCYIGFADRALADAALGRLLPVTDLAPDAIETFLRNSVPEPLFDVKRISDVDVTPWSPASQTEHLTPPPAPPDTSSAWRLHSYTGVARRIYLDDSEPLPAIEFRPGFGDDELETTAAQASRFSRFSFPRGPRAGVALHSLLEDLDFTLPITDQEDAVTRCLDRIGLTRNRLEWSNVLSDWISAVLATPLTHDLSLSTVDNGRRLDEMEFHFPLATDARILNLMKGAGYLQPEATLSVDTLQGMMTGLIDLVFEAGGRYYLVDYKSNFLGDSGENYGTVQLTEAVRHHQYDLQYLIYCVALTRYLRHRMPAFNYASDFGGVYYLFLRGMSGEDGTGGVFFDKPDASFIARLDRAMGGQ